MYAVVETGGKQYRVEKGDALLVDRLPEKKGAKVSLRLLAISDKEMLIGKDAAKAKVEATVAEHLRGPKIRIFNYKAKKGYRRNAGHRSELTRLEITGVSLSGGSSSSATVKKPAAKKPAAKKPAAKKPAAKRPAAKKESGDGS